MHHLLLTAYMRPNHMYRISWFYTFILYSLCMVQSGEVWTVMLSALHWRKEGEGDNVRYNNNNNNRRLVTLAEHTSDHGRQTNSSTELNVRYMLGFMLNFIIKM